MEFFIFYLRECQPGFDLLNALETGVHGHSGPDDIALDVSERVARFIVLIDGESSQGCHPFLIKSLPLLNAGGANQVHARR